MTRLRVTPSFNVLVLNLLWLGGVVSSPSEKPIIWTGGVTDNSFVLSIEASGSDSDLILVSTGSHVQRFHVPYAKKADLVTLNVTGLLPDHRYSITLAKSPKEILGSLRTFPKEGAPHSFSFAFASCSKWAEKGQTWKSIMSHQPNFMVHTGDLHYSNIVKNDTRIFLKAIKGALSPPAQRELFSQMPVIYMFDDHDFGPNDATGSSPSRLASIEAYRSYTPHYPLQNNGEKGVYQAFTYGRVRFILTDLRSMSDDIHVSTLGAVQKNWFYSELSRWQQYKAIVWVSTKPWIGAENDSDRWFGYAHERREISNFIATLGIRNLIMIAGDAHMIAADDGTNSDYSDGTDGHSQSNGAGFPLLHSAPIANKGSSKGGPYSEGCHAYKKFPTFQYSILTMTDDEASDSVCFSYAGYEAGLPVPAPKITLKKCITPDNPSWVIRGKLGGGQGSCPIPMLPSNVLLGILGLLSLVVVASLGLRRVATHSIKRKGPKSLHTVRKIQ